MEPKVVCNVTSPSFDCRRCSHFYPHYKSDCVDTGNCQLQRVTCVIVEDNRAS